MRARQVIDTARLSLAQFAEAAQLPLTGETRGRPRRHAVDALRTVYWFYLVRERTKLLSAYALERHFEPGSFIPSADGVEVQRRNKWRQYRVGQHVPAGPLTLHVEREVSGTAAALNAPLWTVLRRPCGTVADAGRCVQLLTPSLQAALADRTAVTGRAPWMPVFDRVLVKMLERRASLDTLALCIVLVDVAVATGETGVAHAWGQALYRQLLILGWPLLTRGIAQPLFDLIAQRIWCTSSFEHAPYWIPKGNYTQLVGQLLDILYHIKDAPFERMSEDDVMRYAQKAVNGDYGIDCLLAFNPIRKVDEGAMGCVVDQVDLSRADFWEAQWAWNMLLMGGHRGPPPAEVRNGTDLWARNTDPFWNHVRA